MNKFCPNCGEKLPENSKFCISCGTRVTTDEEQTRDSQTEDKNRKNNRETDHVENQEEQMRVILHKHADYYLQQFADIEKGETGKFNWPSFLFSLPHALYRKCGKHWVRWMKIPLILTGILTLYVIYSIMNMKLGALLFGAVLELGIGIFALIRQYQYARQFNRQYLRIVKEKLEKNEISKGVSVRNVVLLLILAVFLQFFLSALIAVSISSGTETLREDWEMDPTEFSIEETDLDPAEFLTEETDLYKEEQQISRIAAEYTGKGEIGEILDDNNQNIIVTAYYEDGNSEEVNGWHVVQPVALEAGKTSMIEILYQDIICDLHVICKVDEGNIMEQSVQVDYEELARNPEQYEGTIIGMAASVYQVEEQEDGTVMLGMHVGSLEEDIFMLDAIGNMMFAYYTYQEGEERILEGDLLNIYGTYQGTKNYSLTDGTTKAVPTMEIYHIEVVTG